MDSKLLGTWAFIVGLILALLTVFVDLGSWVQQVLIVLGILVGVFHPVGKKFVTLGVVYLGLLATAAAMNELLYLGELITAIATAWVGFLGPVVLTSFMLWASSSLFSTSD